MLDICISKLLSELGKTAMTRYGMVLFIESCDDITDNKKGLNKLAKNVADELIHNTKKYSIKNKNVKCDKYDMVYFFVGDDAKIPNSKKITTKSNESMITDFDSFVRENYK